jgi:hypothetical protein
MAMKSGALRALWASTRGSLAPKLLPRAPSHRFCSAVATKLEAASTAKPVSASESESASASASASEHAVANVANVNLRSRTWDEHRLTADQLQYRDLASVRASLSLYISQYHRWINQVQLSPQKTNRPYNLARLPNPEACMYIWVCGFNSL